MAFRRRERNVYWQCGSLRFRILSFLVRLVLSANIWLSWSLSSSLFLVSKMSNGSPPIFHRYISHVMEVMSQLIWFDESALAHGKIWGRVGHWPSSSFTLSFIMDDVTRGTFYVKSVPSVEKTNSVGKGFKDGKGKKGLNFCYKRNLDKVLSKRPTSTTCPFRIKTELSLPNRFVKITEGGKRLFSPPTPRECKATLEGSLSLNALTK